MQSENLGSLGGLATTFRWQGSWQHQWNEAGGEEAAAWPKHGDGVFETPVPQCIVS